MVLGYPLPNFIFIYIFVLLTYFLVSFSFISYSTLSSFHSLLYTFQFCLHFWFFTTFISKTKSYFISFSHLAVLTQSSCIYFLALAKKWWLLHNFLKFITKYLVIIFMYSMEWFFLCYYSAICFSCHFFLLLYLLCILYWQLFSYSSSLKGIFLRSYVFYVHVVEMPRLCFKIAEIFFMAQCLWALLSSLFSIYD